MTWLGPFIGGSAAFLAVMGYIEWNQPRPLRPPDPGQCAEAARAADAAGPTAVTDEVVTHDEVLHWQPDSIRREWAEVDRAREMAMPPEERGWATADEVADLPGQWIPVQELSEPEPRYLPGNRP